MHVDRHLLIDSGNSRIKWALIEPSIATVDNPSLVPWREMGVVAQDEIEQLQEAWHPYSFSHVWISNVAGQVVHDQIERILSQRSEPVPTTWFTTPRAYIGVENKYACPEQLGCDRFLSAVAAHYLFPDQAWLIITSGTATTLDVLTGEGAFLGGLIMPGLPLMMRALATNTANLRPNIESSSILALYANNTQDAIVSGCITAHIGAIEHVWAGLLKERPALQCLLTGGGATFIAPHLSIPFHKVDNLVLRGLVVIAKGLPVTF